jgi:GTPase
VPKLKKVTLVGRMNVGKSTLFNRLTRTKVRRIKSMVLDYDGVTRDLISQEVTWKDNTFELVDSGGITLVKQTDILQEEVRKKALASVETSDVVVFMCDGLVGVTEHDRQLARHLHKQGIPTILAVNKMEKSEDINIQYEFAGLGFDHVYMISALKGIGVKELLATIVGLFPDNIKGQATESEKYRLVMLGKPNVGKSSLMNKLVGDERSIVSDIEGTTRETVEHKISIETGTFMIADTAGLRRQKSVKGEIEPLMVKSTLKTVENSDVVLLLIDGTEARLVDQELKLAFWTFTKKHKSLILLVNKDDVCDVAARASFDYEASAYKFLLKKVPLMRISCKSGKNINKIMPLVEKLWERSTQEFTSEEMTLVVQEQLAKRPLFVQKHRLKLHWIEQESTAPLTFLAVVCNWRWWGDSQKGYLERILRTRYDLVGVPLVINFREKRAVRKEEKDAAAKEVFL